MPDCIFCDIAFSKVSADITKNTDSLVVFKSIKPKAPIHLLIVPKKHVQSIAELADEDRALVSDMIYVARDMARDQGLMGYRLAFNVGRAGGQIVDHLHLHLLGGWGSADKMEG
ncbi:MAG: Hit-like protein involved in cell-cycle regulation [Parcubacteria group bacterium Gr01-1014_70]|nr:MAG: Hit-like protein involved in cell-cycle regulation [Parcubacteria group bacterium Gr01-1014_70]